jgi:phosphatidylglycerol:prolipoprotein diacylglycerol transferase
LTLFDLTTAAVPVGLFLGRCANFINGELFGRATDVPWAMVFPYGGDVPRHPSQLYEAVLEGLVLLAILTPLVWRRGALMRPGLITGLFGIGYGLARFVVEFFREPDAHIGFLFGAFTMGQLLSAVMVVLGAAFVAAAIGGRTARAS